MATWAFLGSHGDRAVLLVTKHIVSEGLWLPEVQKGGRFLGRRRGKWEERKNSIEEFQGRQGGEREGCCY